MARPASHDDVTLAVVRKEARANEFDRYLAALLAPGPARNDLITLAAFMGEVARAVETVSEPMMGEIRLQWWSDVLADMRSGVVTGSPVADALTAMIARRELPEQQFIAILDANVRALQPGFPATEQDVEGYLGASDAGALQLSAQILGVAVNTHSGELLNCTAQAYGRVRLLRALPRMLANGRSPIPPPQTDSEASWAAAAEPTIRAARTWLQEARSRAADAPPELLPALLPLALVEPYLAALQGLGPDIVRQEADIFPLTRVWRLWRASILGRV